MKDKYIPKLAGYYLDIENIRDNFDNSLSVHEYPNSNRNKIENLGQKTRRIHVECSFQETPATTPGWSAGEALFPTYAAHFGLLEIIRNVRENLPFTHPKYGEIEGKIDTFSSYHDDTLEFAKISCRK